MKHTATEATLTIDGLDPIELTVRDFPWPSAQIAERWEGTDLAGPDRDRTVVAVVTNDANLADVERVTAAFEREGYQVVVIGGSRGHRITGSFTCEADENTRKFMSQLMELADHIPKVGPLMVCEEREASFIRERHDRGGIVDRWGRVKCGRGRRK